MEDPENNISNALWWATNKLKSNGIDSAQIDAELLLCRALETKREYLYKNPEEEVEEKRYFFFEKLIAKRLLRIPVAYLLGEKYFFGLKFFVNENVLIPRPETEELIFLTLKQIKKLLNNQPVVNVLEIGTGSGAIIIAIAKSLENFPQKEQVKLFASDKSDLALNVAETNIEKYGLNDQIRLFQSDLLANIPDNFDINLIVANLPYLNEDRINECSPEIKYEPKMALFASNNGKGLYEKLFREINERKIDPKVIIECEEYQKADLEKLYNNLITFTV